MNLSLCHYDGVDNSTLFPLGFPDRPPQVINGRPGVDDKGYHEVGLVVSSLELQVLTCISCRTWKELVSQL